MGNKKTYILFLQKWRVVIFLLIVGIVYMSIGSPDFIQCKLNPDQCTCETKLCIYTGNGRNIMESTSLHSNNCYDYFDSGETMSLNKVICTSYRKLTTEELKIKYCNENPNDKENCVCDEYEKILYEAVYVNFYLVYDCNDIYKHQNNKSEILTDGDISYLIQYGNCKFAYINKSIIQHFDDSCIKSSPIPEPIKIDLEKEKCVEWDDEIFFYKNKYFDGFNDMTCKDVHIAMHNVMLSLEDYTSTKQTYDEYCCTKKEPKTECEKGNPNYIIDSICGDKPLPYRELSSCNKFNEEQKKECIEEYTKHNHIVDEHKKAIEQCKIDNCRQKTQEEKDMQHCIDGDKDWILISETPAYGKPIIFSECINCNETQLEKYSIDIDMEYKRWEKENTYQTCRLKTFEDLTCKELEQAWQINGICFESNQIVYSNNYFFCKGRDFYNREQIEHQQLLKRCFK